MAVNHLSVIFYPLHNFVEFQSSYRSHINIQVLYILSLYALLVYWLGQVRFYYKTPVGWGMTSGCILLGLHYMEEALCNKILDFKSEIQYLR